MEVLYGNKKINLVEKEYFMASSEPLYYGLIVNPSSDLWSYMVKANNIVCNFNKSTEKYAIPYRIDVGENSIFFVTPESKD
ncbi:hypothetical protein [Ferroplasma sp.]|jgi:hypothetical protein|uniref:hypothetical protein n=1 Tax=Ferroplasma sp. TaxID=2591003 RepID=UPI00260C4E91|nr:hypothetical protein [Ferroplasma sp.]